MKKYNKPILNITNNLSDSRICVDFEIGTDGWLREANTSILENYMDFGDETVS